MPAPMVEGRWSVLLATHYKMVMVKTAGKVMRVKVTAISEVS